MTLIKEMMIDSIYNRCDLSRPQATKAVETLLEEHTGIRRRCPHQRVWEILCKGEEGSERSESSDWWRFDA